MEQKETAKQHVRIILEDIIGYDMIYQCPECGSPIKDDTFCPECGWKGDSASEYPIDWLIQVINELE